MTKEQKCIARMKLLKLELDKHNVKLDTISLPQIYNTMCEDCGIPVMVMSNGNINNVVYIINRRVYDCVHGLYGKDIDSYLLTFVGTGVVNKLKKINNMTEASGQDEVVKKLFEIHNGKSLNTLRYGLDIGNYTIKSVSVDERNEPLSKELDALINAVITATK